jgi:hypothetical protein
MDDDAYQKHNKPESGAKPGVYKHKETEEELQASSFPAADAFVRQGWVFDRPLPPRDTNPGEDAPAPGTGRNVK